MIEIKNLNISFNDEVIFNNFSLSLKKGEKLALTGKSGKGKSTLLNLLGGFIPNFGGEVLVNGIVLNRQNINEIRKLTAWLPQEFAFNFKTVNELLFAPFNFMLNRENRPDKEQVLKMLDSFEISETLLTKKVKEISGGQKQRIILASCMLLQKPILLFDEPTSALDESIKQRVSDYILNKKDLTVIAASHDKYWIENSDLVIQL